MTNVKNVNDVSCKGDEQSLFLGEGVVGLTSPDEV